MLKHIYEEEGQRREQVISADVDNEREEGNLPRIDETAVLSESCSFSTSNDDDSSSSTTEPISNISSWEKGELLGRGSFGSVYEGISDDGLFFAFKEVSLLDQGTQGKQSIYQLEQEIALLSRFEHENIVQYYGTDKDESKLYIFLELVTKGSLQKLYQTYNLRDSQVSSYTRQILHGLKYLHDQKVVHRDIKCANLLVDANGSVKLADFGLAKATKLNDVKSCKGTANWMAPEVVNNKNQGYGLSADIWSLGCTVLEMLTRQIPYSELESRMQALFRIGKGVLPHVPDSLSNDARDFILQCLQVNPNDRPTAAVLLDHPFVKKNLILNDVQNMVRGRTEPVEEHDVENGGRLLQPGAGATSFRIPEDNPSETRGVLLLTGSTRLVGQAFEENKNVIWSWLTNDEVSTIGIYGMGGAGKTTMLKHINNELLQSPDIPHYVYWVTVSQDFSVPKLQNKIAKHIKLSFSNEEEELGQRAAELSRELVRKQRWILILDDLWKSFELDKVGIPASLKGCKLIMTTRSEAVCLQMNSKNNVRVNPLSNDEAWTLFMEVLGHEIPLYPQMEQVARDITKECAGLPLGIKTIAGTMKGVNGMHEWSDALEDLKQSKVPQDRVEDEVFQILRFSYTHLRDRAMQKCFLLCGLFPEDFVIPRENLIDYLIDEGLIKQQKSRDAEINKGHTMLDKLEKACLLERLHGGKCVKMHDLIRDMAIQILEENSQAIVKAGAQLKELPDVEELSEKHKSLSLMHNQIEEICSRHSLRCPNLSTLLLCDNYRLRFIVDSFFDQLHGLKVLDLSRTNIECLPDSVSDLEDLTSLLLKDCWSLSSVPSLKKLRALKRLDLSHAPLEKIPHGMECLSNLRYLRMNGCGEMKFPSGILPKLCDLQVFVLEEELRFNDGIGREIYAPVTVEGKEVGCLRKLENLECHFEDQSNYLEYLKSRDATQSLRTYKIVIGQLREDDNKQLRYKRGGTKLVVLGNLNINRDADFLVISSNDIQQLICKSIDAGSIGDVLPLKYSLSSCNSMASLVSSSWFCSAPLPHPSPSYNGIFSALKLLSCYGCKSMKKLFPSVLLPNLVNLEEIEVDDCEKMEEIIGGTSSDEEGVMGEESNEFKLPKLRSLRLQGLPELKSICSAKLICDSLQEIKVSKCNYMEILVPSSWSCLVNLERIEVSDCEKMEEIIGGTRLDEEGVMGEESSEFKLPKLRNLILSNLLELKSISSAKLICNSLENIVVCKCNSIEILVPSSWSCLLNLEKITIRECQKMEEIIGGTRSDEKGVMGEESISSEFKFPKLRELDLVDLPELKSIYNAKLICDSLEVIAVLHCEKLKRIPICLPLLENGQPSPPPSLKVIRIYPKEWWESVEWEHPNAKDVLPLVSFLASKTEIYIVYRPFRYYTSPSGVHMQHRRFYDPNLTLKKKKK